VARELVGRLRDRKRTEDKQRSIATERLAGDVQELVVNELRRLRVELEQEFRSIDETARIVVSYGEPGSERANWWRGQIVYTARCVGIFADLHDGSWWVSIRVEALTQVLRFLVVIQKVGRGNRGVSAVTTFAEVLDRETDAPPAEFRRAFEPTARDRVTLAHTNSAEERWPEVAELIDRTLSTALKYFVDQLS
jgi:hypothetical protein